MTIEELSKKSKIPLKKIKDGHVERTKGHINSLSNTTRLHQNYFLRNSNSKISKISFRGSNIAEENLRAEILEHFERVKILLDKTNTDLLFSPPPSLSKINKTEDIETVADEVRESWFSGNTVLRDIVRVLENHNIMILEIPNKNLIGCSGFIDDKYCFIATNSSDNLPTKYFTLLHELGHVLLLNQFPTPFMDEEEVCNRFAASLLISWKDISNDPIPTDRAELQNFLVSKRNKYFVSHATLCRRLEELSLLSEEMITICKSIREENAEGVKEAYSHFSKAERPKWLFHNVRKAYEEKKVDKRIASIILERKQFNVSFIQNINIFLNKPEKSLSPNKYLRLYRRQDLSQGEQEKIIIQRKTSHVIDDNAKEELFLSKCVYYMYSLEFNTAVLHLAKQDMIEQFHGLINSPATISLISKHLRMAQDDVTRLLKRLIIIPLGNLS